MGINESLIRSDPLWGTRLIHIGPGNFGWRRKRQEVTVRGEASAKMHYSLVDGRIRFVIPKVGTGHNTKLLQSP